MLAQWVSVSTWNLHTYRPRPARTPARTASDLYLRCFELGHLWPTAAYSEPWQEAEGISCFFFFFFSCPLHLKVDFFFMVPCVLGESFLSCLAQWSALSFWSFDYWRRSCRCLIYTCPVLCASLWWCWLSKANTCHFSIVFPNEPLLSGDFSSYSHLKRPNWDGVMILFVESQGKAIRAIPWNVMAFLGS